MENESLNDKLNKIIVRVISISVISCAVLYFGINYIITHRVIDNIHSYFKSDSESSYTEYKTTPKEIESVDEYITNNNFTINGNGIVRFSGSTNGTIVITGGRADLQGQYNIILPISRTV